MSRTLLGVFLITLASPAGATTLFTTPIARGGAEYLECQALNTGKKPVDVTFEIRAVTSPPPEFFACKTQTVTVRPGRVEGVESFASECGASGPYYAQVTFKAGKTVVRASCYALENPALRSEAR